ncbi:Tetratricopeptide repeat protein 27-like protein [Auxenochlorella protothecoides]|uniref:Tetratricopeptide repeat protein 27-like protein n=1 Tax=Auxenochlorella protothecoides TaxID=3075 RepID=A0A087SB11_AUXPR|nr:Tetratricopeptide repeat protein 27-like protein [Auxenochlorella protothecoides]KFM22915.1 Tetratricopeptide repeat protein 27-like protein [Auxenochlorella protothecoides]
MEIGRGGGSEEGHRIGFAPGICFVKGWAISQLSEDGEDVEGVVVGPQYLLLARRVADARSGLDVADGLAGFGAELAGVLGTRTAHQTEAKAQLVVSVSRRGAWVRDRGAARVDDLLPPDVAAAGARPTQTPDGADDVLPGPRLVEGAGGRPPAAAAPRDLHSLEQALLLARAALLRKGSAGDAVRAGQLAAYAEAVVAQDLSQWVLATAARLQLARLELERPRTRIRGLASLEGVEEAGGAPRPPAAARLRCAFFGALPLRTPLRRELGEALVAAGAVASALPLFEGVELWDSVIVCYQLLGKRGAAEALVRRRLEVRPSDPRLWCALGDLSLDPGHYRRAWEASGGRSARAQRSLARLAAGAGRHAEAAGHWRAALALSPLHPEGWFSLGYACLKERDHAGARAAFTRAAQQQPDNGEAWNNLGAAHIALRAWRPAFAALTEALRHKRDSWQAWENYGAVAARAREWQAAAHALQEVLRLSDGARLDLEALEALAAACGAGGAELWGLFARYHEATSEDPSLALECRLKEVRALQGAAWQSDTTRFERFARASLALGVAHLRVAAAAAEGGGRRELSAARMHLRGVVRAAEPGFGDHALHAELRGALQDVQARLDAL